MTGRDGGADGRGERARVLCEVSRFMRASSVSGGTRGGVEREDKGRAEGARGDETEGGERVGVVVLLTVLPVRALIALYMSSSGRNLVYVV